MVPDSTPTRRCSKCKRNLTEEHFAPSAWRKGGYCRPCAAAYMQRYVVENRDAMAAYAARRVRPGPLYGPKRPRPERLPVHGPPVPPALIACAWCGEVNEGRRYCGPNCTKAFHKRKASRAEVLAGRVRRSSIPNLKHPAGSPCRYCNGPTSKNGAVQCDDCQANNANVRDHRRRYRRAKRAARQGEPYVDQVVAALFGWKCQLCGKAIPKSATYADKQTRSQSLTMDHIVPISLGGADEAANVQPAHFGCNSSKRNGVRPEGEQLRLCA